MWKYILKRVLWLIPSLLAVSLIICFLAVLTPGEPARIILGNEATDTDIAKFNHEMGLDKPFFEQYLDFIVGILLVILEQAMYREQHNRGNQDPIPLYASSGLHWSGAFGIHWHTSGRLRGYTSVHMERQCFDFPFPFLRFHAGLLVCTDACSALFQKIGVAAINGGRALV